MSKTTSKTTSIQQEAASTLRRLESKDPGLGQLLKKAYGYAVFPTVGKAALVVGGSYGKGAVFERGKFVGYATLGQTTLGVQIGGDTFSEVIVFENKQQLDRLKQGKMSFAADASAVLVKAGAAAAKGFGKGTRAFVYGAGGMLLEAAIGGQKFTFKPAGEEEEEGDQGGRQQGRRPQQRGQQEHDEERDDQQDDESESDDESDLMTRAASGMRTAVSQTTDFVKRHPVITSFVGAGVATGVALIVIRKLRSSADEGQEEDEESDRDQNAQDSYEDQEEQDDQDADKEEGSHRFAGSSRRSSR